jgi:16S rRNA (uracil1498-N3)-methyltransferase
MHRFFVPNDTLRDKQVRLTGEVAHQVSRVLRMRPGDEVVLLDGLGYEYRVRLGEFGKDEVMGLVTAKTRGLAEPAHALDLYLSLLNKPDKFEWALQKCTELGVLRFVPLAAGRSVSGAPEQGRRERWGRIIQEAAEQSGRCVLPVLDEAMDFDAAVRNEAARMESENHLALVAALGADLSLREALSSSGPPDSVSLFIGPEGGFSDDELAAASDSGACLVSLGPRTLRAETAAVACATMVMFALGEMR